MNYFVVCINDCDLSNVAKTKVQFQCNECGAMVPKWAGQCPECNAWNTLIEIITETGPAKSGRFREFQLAEVCYLAAVDDTDTVRISSGLSELDRAIGGGLVSGSVILLGGDPGIGKSTLLIQVLEAVSRVTDINTLYVSGEESARQISLRGKRLGLQLDRIRLLTENNLERIMAVTGDEKPGVLVIDSIQTIYTDLLQSAPGSVAQVRECAAHLVRYAKQTNTTVLLVGHVTKEGTLAGPRVLEHMVDTVLYFEGDTGSRFRVIRTVKNRYGAVNELGVFAMTDKGLREVSNPSAIFISQHETRVAGSIVMVTREGTRPLLVEVQALVDESHLANPRRVTVGLEQNRLAMLLAVLHRHGSITTFNQDVFINIVGGVKISETAADLPVIMAVVSSLKNNPLPEDMIVFGEIGLAGEVRPVQNGPERLHEAVKHGFKQAIIPRGNSPKQGIKGMQIKIVNHLQDALKMVNGK